MSETSARAQIDEGENEAIKAIFTPECEQQVDRMISKLQTLNFLIDIIVGKVNAFSEVMGTEVTKKSTWQEKLDELVAKTKG